MLLRNRAPGIDQRPATTTKGFEHLPADGLAVLGWLNANRVDYVLVGPVARSVRGDTSARGPVAIVPAPYGRNLDRLARALWSAHARLRVDGGSLGSPGSLGSGSAGNSPAHQGGDGTVPIKMSAEKLVRAERWTLRCGSHDLDVEGRPAGVPRYQELLYEAARFTLAEELAVEVAAPEDIEHYDHVRRTGSSPELKVSRAVREPDLP